MGAKERPREMGSIGGSFQQCAMRGCYVHRRRLCASCAASRMDQFPRIVGMGGLLHIFVKTPGIFAIKGKLGSDRCCHRHSTS